MSFPWSLQPCELHRRGSKSSVRPFRQFITLTCNLTVGPFSFTRILQSSMHRVYMRCQVANTLTIKFMSAHFLTDNCEKVFSSWHTVILTHTPHYSAAEQCKATHPVCVTLTYGTPASLNQTESLHQSSIDPHSFGPTPLIRSASFSCYTHTHTDAGSPTALSFPPNLPRRSTLPQPYARQIVLVSSSCIHTHLKPHIEENHADSILMGSTKRRVECQGLSLRAQGQEIRLCGG